VVDLEEQIQTPMPIVTNVNVADIRDWQQRAKDSEHALKIEQNKHERTKRMTRQLQAQLD
jgi:hypothetical protein